MLILIAQHATSDHCKLSFAYCLGYCTMQRTAAYHVLLCKVGRYPF